MTMLEETNVRVAGEAMTLGGVARIWCNARERRGMMDACCSVGGSELTAVHHLHNTWTRHTCARAGHGVEGGRREERRGRRWKRKQEGQKPEASKFKLHATTLCVGRDPHCENSRRQRARPRKPHVIAYLPFWYGWGYDVIVSHSLRPCAVCAQLQATSRLTTGCMKRSSAHFRLINHDRCWRKGLHVCILYGKHNQKLGTMEIDTDTRSNHWQQAARVTRGRVYRLFNQESVS